MAAVAEILSSNPKLTRVRIEGHADNRGNPVANLEWWPRSWRAA